MPALAGWLAVVAGVVNIASALTPDFSARARLLRHTLPSELPLLAHAFALSAGVALVVLGFYLARRRRSAWCAGVVVLLVAGAVNLLKGLDVEEALAGWFVAAVLLWGRDAFYVREQRSGWLTAARRVTLIAGSCLATIGVLLLVASHWASRPLDPARALGELAAPLTLSRGPVAYRDPFEWVSRGIGVVELGALLAIAYVVFRPLALPGRLPQPGMRALARRIVDLHGRDSLSFFKLRADQPYFFDRTGRAFAAYRIEGGVLLVSGDPVGPPECLPGLMRDLCSFAEVRGLKVGVLGASEPFATLAASAGLKSLYIGDE